MLTFSISKKFVAGMLTYSALQSLQMDYWGMEGTIRHIVNDWWSPWATVPMAIGLLVLAAWLCHESKIAPDA